MGLFSKKPKPHKIHSLDELEPFIESGRPVLLDFMQVGCSPCQVMDGIMNELAREYGESAHIVKVDVAKVPGAAQVFKVRSTPTFVLLGSAPEKKSKKARRREAETVDDGQKRITARWRTAGLVKKDQLARVLESNGAEKVSA
jgi:thiol-disulfide isomerase/thioredoxin